eukprot:4603996-Prymnesium_polylepis.1
MEMEMEIEMGMGPTLGWSRVRGREGEGVRACRCLSSSSALLRASSSAATSSSSEGSTGGASASGRFIPSASAVRPRPSSWALTASSTFSMASVRSGSRPRDAALA